MLHWTDILIRLSLAALLGGLVGFERERKDWAVGIRTHMMACMGSALVMIVSSFGFSDILGTPHVMLDPSRVASSVIIGIGYLGAGIILVLKKGNIKGLTTASGLWTTAGIGLACGGGMYFTGAAATVIALIILYAVQLLQRKFSLKSIRQQLSVTVSKKENLTEVIDFLQQELEIVSVSAKRKHNHFEVKAVVISVNSKMPKLLEGLHARDFVESVRLK